MDSLGIFRYHFIIIMNRLIGMGNNIWIQKWLK